MRVGVIAVVGLSLILSACAAVGVAADAASIAGSVVSTTVSTAGTVVGAAAHTVAGGSNQDKKSE